MAISGMLRVPLGLVRALFVGHVFSEPVLEVAELVQIRSMPLSGSVRSGR